MSKAWKNLRTNMMYWRFRFVTRNRLRLHAWWLARRGPKLHAVPTYPRDRGMSYRPYHHSSRDTWITLLVVVALLTGLKVLASRVFVYPSVMYALGAAVVIGGVYLTLRRL